MKTLKSALTWSVVVTTIAWSVGASLLVAPLAAGATATLTAGSLIKGSLPAVYYYGGDGKRYVFPNEATYKTWYADFSGVQTITDADLAAITIGGNVTYKPGVKMVKITTDPKVYAVDAHGTLRHVATEAVAVALYGATWASLVNDVPDAFFVNYTVGTAVAAAADFAKDTVAAAATSINVDKNLGGTVATPVTGTITVSDGGSPAGATIPSLGADVIFAKVKLAGTGTVTGIKVTRTGLSKNADLSSVKLFDGTTQVGSSKTFGSDNKAYFTNISVAVAGEKTLTLAGSIASVAAGTAVAGDIVILGVEAAADVTLAAGTVGGTFPIRGNGMTISSVIIGTATLALGSLYPPVGNTVDPDATAFRFNQVKITAAGEALALRQIVAIKNGTSANSDLKDITLWNDRDGVALAKVASLTSDGKAVFDVDATVPKGENREYSILATLTGGGSSRTVSFDLHDGTASTIRLVGKTYGFGVTPADGTFCTTACQTTEINLGKVSISRSPSSPPTGNIAVGKTMEPISAYDFRITGEPITISRFKVTLTPTGATGATSMYTNIALYDSTGSIVAGPQDGDHTTAQGAQTFTFSDTFTVPVGTSTYTLKASIATTATGTITATFLDPDHATNGITAKGVQSNRTLTATEIQTGSDVTANVLSVLGPTLAVTTLATPIAGTVVGGMQEFTFAKFYLDASAGGEDIRVTAVKSRFTGTGTTPTDDLENLELWGDADTTDSDTTVKYLGTTNATSTNAATMTFTFQTPLHIAKSKAATLELRADVKLSQTDGNTYLFKVTDTNGAALLASEVTAKGWTTGNDATVGLPSGAGQAQTYASAGTLKVELAADRASSGPVVAGSTGVSVMKYKLTASNENFDLTTLGVGYSGTESDLKTIKVYASGAQVGNLTGYAPDASGKITVTLDSGTVVAQKDVPLYIELKADLQPKEQLTSGDTAIVGLLSTASATGATTTVLAAAGVDGYNIVAKGLSSGSAVDQTTITSNGLNTGTTGTGNTLALFDGVLAIDLHALSPSGPQVAGTSNEVLRFSLTATGDTITVNDIGFVISGSATGGDAAGQIGDNGGDDSVGTGTATLHTAGDLTDAYASWTDAEVTGIPLDPTSGTLHILAAVSTTNAAVWTKTLEIAPGTTKVMSVTGDTTGAGGQTSSKYFQMRIDNALNVTSGILWSDTQLTNLVGVGCTTAAPVLGVTCSVNSASYTKTLPVTGKSLSY